MSLEIRATSKLPRGLYDGLVTEALAELLDSLGGVGEPEFMDLRNADAADRIAFHVAKVIESAPDRLPDEDRAAAGIRLARYLIDESPVKQMRCRCLPNGRLILSKCFAPSAPIFLMEVSSTSNHRSFRSWTRRCLPMRLVNRA